MARVVKLTVSLPRDLLEAVDRRQQVRGGSRSEFVRRALEHVLREEQEQQDVERYVRGYREQPETDEEALAMHQLASAVLAQEPWE